MIAIVESEEDERLSEHVKRMANVIIVMNDNGSIRIIKDRRGVLIGKEFHSLSEVEGDLLRSVHSLAP